jgi:hypothetical protein
MKNAFLNAVRLKNNSLFNLISISFSSVKFTVKVQLLPEKWLNVYTCMFHAC